MPKLTARVNPRSQALTAQVGERASVAVRLDPTRVVEVVRYECPLVLHNVMGQEDAYREEEGRRVVNAGTARIAWATGAPANARIRYGLVTGNAYTLTDDTGVLPGEVTLWHEHFVGGLSVSSLYAFQVESQSPHCGGPPAVSETYYFLTGNKVALRARLRGWSAQASRPALKSALATLNPFSTGTVVNSPDVHHGGLGGSGAASVPTLASPATATMHRLAARAKIRP